MRGDFLDEAWVIVGLRVVPNQIVAGTATVAQAGCHTCKMHGPGRGTLLMAEVESYERSAQRPFPRELYQRGRSVCHSTLKFYYVLIRTRSDSSRSRHELHAAPESRVHFIMYVMPAPSTCDGCSG